MINRHGRREKFNKSWWVVLDVGEFYYWTGWMRPSSTLWINKKPIAWRTAA